MIALVPRWNNVSNMRHYRRISCCSVVYKSITTILSTRLKKFLPKLVFWSQSDFIFERSIYDNIIFAQELVCGYARRSLSPRAAIKVDFMKAFDSFD